MPRSSYTVSHNGAILFRIVPETFSLNGPAVSPEIEDAIRRSRCQAASDLKQARSMATIYYSPELGSNPHEIDYNPETILVKREGSNIVLEAIANIWVQKKPGDYKYIPHPDTPELTVCTAQMSMRPIMGLIAEYAKYYCNSDEVR
jgi:hypothetical protein